MPPIKAIEKAAMKAVLSSIKEHNTAKIYRTTLPGVALKFFIIKRRSL
jgi:hypothetical protein